VAKVWPPLAFSRKELRRLGLLASSGSDPLQGRELHSHAKPVLQVRRVARAGKNLVSRSQAALLGVSGVVYAQYGLPVDSCGYTTVRVVVRDCLIWYAPVPRAERYLSGL